MAIDDMIPMVLCVRYFLIAQGFIVLDNVFYKANQSTMELSENDKRSSGKQIQHLNIRYFFCDEFDSEKNRG